LHAIDQESREKEIHLQEVNPDAFAIVLEYLYSKDIHVAGPSMPFDLMMDTFILASQYGLEPLKLKLEYLMLLNITVENVCCLLVHATAHNASKVSFPVIDLIQNFEK